MITVRLLAEAGYDAAMYGLSLSYKVATTGPDAMQEIATKLAPKDHGHNKFMEQIMTWWDIQAPRYWWQEADTYRLSSKSSESTMHTLVKEIQSIKQGEEQNYIDTNFESNSCTMTQFELIRRAIDSGLPIELIKSKVPEGFLQRRMWMLSYKELRHILLQRHTHRLPHWQVFCYEVMNQVVFPGLLGVPFDADSLRKYRKPEPKYPSV